MSARGGGRGLGPLAAALIALLMLSVASVRSTVMQVAMAAPAPTVGGYPAAAGAMSAMAGMDMAQAHSAAPAPHLKHGHAKPATCPYCAVAGHLPVLNAVTPVRTPVAFSFASFHVAAGRGPRGPPSVQPRARGPPADSLSL